MKAFTTVNKSAVYASYNASYKIAKKKKAHTIGKKLVLPVMKKVVKMMRRKKCEKLNALSLSNNTVKRQVEDMSVNVLNQYANQAKASPFYAIQLHKPTDVAGFPKLSVFIRFIYNGKLSKKLLLCNTLLLHTKGEDIFKCLDTFFNEYSIPWENCAGICTDDTGANTDQYQPCSSEMC